MVCELFHSFRNIHGVFPRRVIIYRDGVSEGQFGEVVYQEVVKIKKAFRSICPEGEMPTMTYIIVTKRHHVRFTPVNQQDGDRKGNVLAGTVVDSGLSHPYEFDFFLNSHPGLQGTSRSAHYHVLMDEHDFTPDNMQEFSYRLCYLFCRRYPNNLLTHT
jgi:eukaryotic translation initiation factor 2C